MNNETNRLAQLIANAADKELGTRSEDGQPKRQDKAAALAIEAEYLFIRRAELPVVGETLNKDTYYVDGSDFLAPSSYIAKKYALADLALWQHVEAKEHARLEAKRELQSRRDALATELAPRGPGMGDNWYTNVSDGLRIAIDRIIELERNAA